MIKILKKILSPIRLFLLFLTNRIINFIPLRQFRKLWYRCFGMKIGWGSQIDMGQYILSPHRLKIGKTSHINQGCILDARAGIVIGDNVSISHRCALMTGSHDINSKAFEYKGNPIKISDFVFVGVNSTILQGVNIGKGAVVCAGAVVTKNVPEYAVVAGIPAKIISYRNKDFNYKCQPNYWFL